MADEIKIDITGLDALAQKLDEFNRLDERVYFPLQEALSQAVQLIEARAKDNLTHNGSVASGALRNKGIGSDITITATEMTGIVYADIRNRGYNYAEAVEFGTAAGHAPPLESLEEWVRLRGITGTVTLSKRRADRVAQLDAIRAAAQNIRWHIYRHGTQAHPFFEPAVKDSRDDILRLFEQAVTEIVANF